MDQDERHDKTTQLLSLSLSALLQQPQVQPRQPHQPRYPDIIKSEESSESLYFSIYGSRVSPLKTVGQSSILGASAGQQRNGRFVDLTLSQTLSPRKTLTSYAPVKPETLSEYPTRPSPYQPDIQDMDDDGDEESPLMDQSGFVPTFFKNSFAATASRMQNSGSLASSYQPNTDTENSLSDSMNRKLLYDDEDNGDEHPIYIDPTKRREKDVFWKYAYLGLFVLWALLGAYSLLRRPDIPSTISPIDRRVLSAIASNAGKVTLWVGLSLLGGGAWLYFLSQFASIIVYTTAILVPAGLFSVSLYGLFSTIPRFWSFRDSSQKSELILVLGTCIAATVSSLLLASMLNRKRGMATTMTHIVQLSCQVLKGNPRLFVLSAGLLSLQITFSVIWVWIVARMLWNQYADSFMSSENQSISLTWPLSWSILLSLFVYFWTSSLLQQYQRMVISSVVGKWYFHRFGGIMSDTTWDHAQMIMDKSFGTFAFSAFINGGVQMYKYLLRKFGKTLRESTQNGPFGLGTASNVILTFLQNLGNILQDVSSYTIIYAGLTGESFLSCAYTCTRLFRRNLVMGLMTHSLTRLLSILGRCMVSLFVSLIVFYSTYDSSYGDDTSSGGKLIGSDWIAASVSGLVSYYILGMITQIIDSTIEATFLCFLVDLDQDTCHCEAAHRIFSESLK